MLILTALTASPSTLSMARKSSLQRSFGVRIASGTTQMKMSVGCPVLILTAMSIAVGQREKENE